MAKGKPPWFKFLPDVFLSSDIVREQRTDAVGAYVLLLASAWVRGLPDHDESLQRITGLGVKRWHALRPVLLAKFQKGADGRLHHPLLEDLLEEYQQGQAAGRQTGHRARSGRGAGGRFQPLSAPASTPAPGNLTSAGEQHLSPAGEQHLSPGVSETSHNGNGLHGYTPRETRIFDGAPTVQLTGGTTGEVRSKIEQPVYAPALEENTPPRGAVDNSAGGAPPGPGPDAQASLPGAGQGPEPAPWQKYLTGVAPVSTPTLED